MMFRKIYLILILLVVLPVPVLAASNTLAPEALGDLSEKNAHIKAKVKELDEIGRDMVAAKAKKIAAADSIERLEPESDQALERLEALQKIDRESPDTISPEKLLKAKEANKQALAALNNAKAKRDDAAAEVRALTGRANEQYSEFQRLQKSFERDMDMVVNPQVDRHIRTLHTAKEVEVTARVACGDESPKACKEKSLKAAELAASERGSVVFVTSLTEIKNFKLSKEELSSEVRATLTNKEVVKQQMFGEAEAYETTLKAKVEPVIGDSLRDQMAEGIRAEIYAQVGGKIDYAQVRNPADADDEEQPKKIEKKKSGSDAREARKAARAEEERRNAAERARAAEEARVAEEERRAAQAAEEERRAEEERNRAARAEEERRRSSIPTFSF